MSPDEARVRMKMWLLAGHEIKKSNDAGKDAHMDISYMSMPLEDEAELDRRSGLVGAM